MELTWRTAEREAKDRISWRNNKWLHYPQRIELNKEETVIYNPKKTKDIYNVK